ncbi:hypothetical protein L861_03080 [Litchfieldella anticariensis FP35 = DSM 16096]|uniref:Thioredoxin domain-containing protein n=1 Tax=Litchfieldella anticariensis (strain DSM 16096 / CECT 5854 / CIP 108499 / LMG 22089 / FP35) TaxID=1121939 RepID=S2KUS5_LITA3|nr:hypothetical protein [Halomonas anticariensis]EPC04318.1 hypothetical protein L861_03080 [Halomonas anticariensis FP35 = DSM 16096]
MTSAGRQRFKLLALMAVFAMPLLIAWVMVEWRVGIPEQRTAHGELEPNIPPLLEWPLREPRPEHEEGDWILAFDCSTACEERADRWWRLHRALGREAPRLTRLRIGAANGPLPGEILGQWDEVPTWQRDGQLWLLDPRGEVVLGYTGDVDPGKVLDDINHLLRINSDNPMEAELSSR